MSLRTDILDFVRSKAGKRRITFPTPVIADVIVLEKFPCRQGAALPAYGDPHPVHTDAKLCHRADSEGEDNQKMVTLVYANDRASQDTYNYAISYASESNAASIYTRSYILPRAGYAPIAKLTDENPSVPTGRKLVKEEAMAGTGDKELDALYIKVVRVFETLPGPELVEYDIEPESGALIRLYRQTCATGTPQKAQNTQYPALSLYYVLYSKFIPIDSVRGTLETKTMQIPPPRYEQESVGFQFPAIFNFITGYALPALNSHGKSWPIQPPWAGVNFTLTSHRTASKAALIYTSYSLALQTCPDTWTVTTPGKASRLFSIGDNTIHNAIDMEMDDGTVTQTVELIDASTPSSYDPTAAIIIRATSKPWIGGMYENKTTVITETLP